MKKLLIAAFLLLITCFIQAQVEKKNDNSEIRSFLQKIHQAYGNAGKLSFRVSYKYANKSQPGNYIDTLNGEIAMNKNHMRFAIAGTETIINSKYTIRVIEDEQLIYLTKVQRGGMLDPVSILDTLLVKAAGGQASVEIGKKSSTMNIRFPAGQPFKSISLTIDEHTGFFQKVVYDLYTSGLVGIEQVNESGQQGHYEKEGRVEVIFSNYQKESFNDSLFDEEQYFKRQGNYFEASARYNGYRVFVASPNL